MQKKKKYRILWAERERKREIIYIFLTKAQLSWIKIQKNHCNRKNIRTLEATAVLASRKYLAESGLK